MPKPIVQNQFLSSLQHYLAAAARVIEIDSGVVESFFVPDRIVRKTLHIKRDTGGLLSIPAFRVQHSNMLGPYKGGIRFHPEVNENKLHALSVEMTLKNSLMQVPLGGAKGGVAIDVSSLSIDEVQRLSRSYVDAFFKHIGPNRDIPAPDINTNAQIMAWMADQYNKRSGEIVWPAFTGKPPEIGGSGVREYATSFGGAVVLQDILEAIGFTASSPTVAVQGFGNVGSNIAKILHTRGFRIVALGDSRCSIFKEDGIDPHDVSQYKSLMDCQGYIRGEPRDILTADVDILIPAAIENQITKENAHKIKGKIILEMANGPITSEADAILHDQGIRVVPDILANAGGVVDSYFEWAQDRVGLFWKKEDEERQLTELMSRIFKNVVEFQKEHKTNMRTAVYALALRRFWKACQLLGRC